MIKSLSVISALGFLAAFTACEEKSTTEKVGESIEDAADSGPAAVEKMGNKIEDATDGN